jgi:hypothetical protein
MSGGLDVALITGLVECDQDVIGQTPFYVRLQEV